ncbi:MAG TPA: O-antigen ligase family protein, partial [Acidobacteriota bacterium]|nr:O-antigen ligase family protein [Acidobacteriota bacterium]
MIVLALLLLLPLVFVVPGSDPFEPAKAALLLTAAAALAGVWMHHMLGGLFAEGPADYVRRGLTALAATLRREPLAGAMVACLAASALSTLLADRPLVSVFGEPTRPAGLLVAVAMTILFASSRAASASPSWFDRVAVVASAAAGVAALYALVQWAGLDPMAWEGAATVDGRVRVPSTLGHPNLLGAYLAMTLPLSSYLAWRHRALAARTGWGAVAGVSIVALAATLSRGAWLAAAVAAVAAALLLLLSRRMRVAGPALAAAALLAVLLFALPLWTPLGEGFRTRLGQIADLRAPTSHSRLLLWEAGARMTADHP